MMTCLMCGGVMESKKIVLSEAITEGDNQLYYIVTDVPAKVCRQCGETVYTAQVVDKLLTISKQVRKGVPAPRTIEVPVYNLHDMAS